MTAISTNFTLTTKNWSDYSLGTDDTSYRTWSSNILTFNYLKGFRYKSDSITDTITDTNSRYQAYGEGVTAKRYGAGVKMTMSNITATSTFQIDGTGSWLPLSNADTYFYFAYTSTKSSGMFTNTVDTAATVKSLPTRIITFDADGSTDTTYDRYTITIKGNGN